MTTLTSQHVGPSMGGEELDNTNVRGEELLTGHGEVEEELELQVSLAIGPSTSISAAKTVMTLFANIPHLSALRPRHEGEGATRRPQHERGGAHLRQREGGGAARLQHRGGGRAGTSGGSCNRSFTSMSDSKIVLTLFANIPHLSALRPRHEGEGTALRPQHREE